MRDRRRQAPEADGCQHAAHLIAIHSNCVLDQQGCCPLLVFVRQLAWEINLLMGCPNDEDKGFRRLDEMCAAKPLSKEDSTMEMFDEVSQKTVQPDGKVETKKLISDEQTIREMDEKEMENAVADFVRSAREFLQLNTRPDLATDSQRPGILWWRALQWLALADSHLKDCFCGQDRSPQSIQRFHCWKLKMIDGRRYRTDA